MTKTVKKSLALILSVIMLLSVMPMSISLAAETADRLVYSTGGSGSNRRATITGYNGTATTVEIPATISSGWSTYNVTSIGNNAFQNKTNIESVTIGDNVQSIGSSAFSGCTNLETVVIGKKVTTINSNAFSGCNKLTINYKGSPAEWEDINISNNSIPSSVTIKYYYGRNCTTEGHVTQRVAGIPATCTESGIAEHWNCLACDGNFANQAGTQPLETTTISARGHEWSAEWTKDENEHYKVCTRTGCGVTNEETVGTHDWEDATCTTDETCSVCGETRTPASGHNMSELTCTEDSVCSNCGFVGETAKGHIEKEPLHIPPTCTTKGYYWETECTVCKEITQGVVEVDPLGHDFVKVISREPTCNENAENKEGYYYYECSRCDETKEEFPPAIEHNYGNWVDTVTATCTSAGSKYRVCVNSDCGKIDSVPVDAFNHIGTDTVETKENINDGTCVIPASYEKVITCVCGVELSRTPITEDKDPDNHTNLVATAATANTCETDGNIDYWTCEGCEKIYSDEAATTEITAAQTVIEKKGHAYGDWTFDADGKHKRNCANDANHIEREDCADVTTDTDCLCDKCGHLVSHSFGNPTCTAPATCSVCDETTGSETGHDYGDWEYDEELEKHIAVCANDEEHIIYGDCENANSDEDCECDYCNRVIEHDFADATCCAPKTCTVCGETEGEINAENHSGEEVVEIEDYIAGTCTSIESYNIVTYCSDCDEPINSEEFEGEKDPDNHQLKEVIPNGGKDKEHYYVCESEGCDYKEDIPHKLGAYSIVDQPTCTEKGRERAHCSICKSFIYREIPMLAHVDANKNAKCDVCDTAMELPVEPDTEEPAPEPEKPPVVEDPSLNCSCNCHARGLKGLFFSIVLFFQRLLGLNRTCDCGNAHY